MVIDGNLHQSVNTATMFNTKRLFIIVQYVMSNSGAFSSFLINGSQVVNIKIAEYTIAIKFPDDIIVWSTHTYNLDIQWLPHEMTEAYIVPGLEHSSLASTKKICEADCKIPFNKLEC